jgi:uncharacterized membrane protein YoaK (UPF0700 family)
VTPSAPSPMTSRQRNVLVTLLAVNSGYVDAIGFLALGGAFTSVMTGNMVLLGLSFGNMDQTLVAHVSLAIACFIAGAAIGTRVAGVHAGKHVIWPAPVTRALAIELTLAVVFSVLWWVEGGEPGKGLQLALLGVNALALGIQSSAVQRFGVSGLSTTYLTGTLTQVVIRLTSGQPIRDVAHSMSLLAALIGGAVLGGVIGTQVSMLVPITPLVLLLVVLGRAFYMEDRSSARAGAQRSV